MKQILLILLLFFSLTSFSQPYMTGIIASSQNNSVASKTYLDVINDGNTLGWYKPTIASNVTASSGVESIWWDMRYGKEGALEAEQSSGVILAFGVYKITATQANFFYTGCAVGDVFVCGTVKTCDANNKVQRFTGNHLTHYDSPLRPVNQVFNGTNQYMRSIPFTWNQPEFIYMVVKQITWTSTDDLFDGYASASGIVEQRTSTPNLAGYAGTWSGLNNGLATNTWGIVRCLFNGASSKLVIDSGTPVTWNCGTNNMGGFVLASRIGGQNWSNIQVAEIILRKSSDTTDDETLLYNYLLSVKNGL